MGGLASLQPRILGILECAAANAAQTKLRATEGAQLRLKTYVTRNSQFGNFGLDLSSISIERATEYSVHSEFETWPSFWSSSFKKGFSEIYEMRCMPAFSSLEQGPRRHCLSLKP